jgi:hypothetical protein
MTTTPPPQKKNFGISVNHKIHNQAASGWAELVQFMIIIASSSAVVGDHQVVRKHTCHTHINRFLRVVGT